MFTGIVEETGTIKDLSKKRDTYRLIVCLEGGLDGVKKGDSISVNGACLTVVDINRDRLAFDITEETFRHTSFRYARRNDIVNIEKSLKWKSRIEGHFVSGHIDTVGRIKAVRKKPRPYLDISVARGDKMYVVRKGSVAIDGISLTIGAIYRDAIRLHIIPYTIENTNLKYRRAGDRINMEFDILGKYILNKVLHQGETPPPLTEKILKDKGFI